MMKRTTIIAVGIVFVAILAAEAQFSKLHDFTGNPDGLSPEGSLYYDGAFLYGMTYLGGPRGNGIIFKVRLDGTQYQILHDFPTLTGGHPRLGALVSDSSFLYGMTFAGGDSLYNGVIFKIRPDGSDYKKIHEFDRHGSSPMGSLLFDGTFLFGMNSSAIFRIKPDGTEYAHIHEFTGWDGMSPRSSLISDGTFLYGMTHMGGGFGEPFGFGVIFRIKPDGTEYSKLMDFVGTNGKYPSGDLYFDGTFLYGMALGGISEGLFDGGVIFRLKPDGSDFKKLWDFNKTTGSYPRGSLIYKGRFLYGVAASGGEYNNGVIFKIGTDGRSYTVLHEFPDSIDGRIPANSMICDGTDFYGMTNSGGSADSGTIYKFHSQGLGHKENNVGSLLTVYPNPCREKLYYKCNDKGLKVIRLFDISVKLLLSCNQSQDDDCSIDISNLENGTYIFSLTTLKENHNRLGLINH